MRFDGAIFAVSVTFDQFCIFIIMFKTALLSKTYRMLIALLILTILLGCISQSEVSKLKNGD
jgi:hypothetical protein